MIEPPKEEALYTFTFSKSPYFLTTPELTNSSTVDLA
jgi:hypothetical protein